MKFALPDQLPKSLAELDGLRNQADSEIAVFKARHAAEDTFVEADVERLEHLCAAIDQIDVARPDAAVRSRLARHEAGHAVMAVLAGGQVATAEVFSEPVTDPDGWSKGGECQCAPMNLAVEQQQPLIAAAGACAEAVWEHGEQASSRHVDELLAGQKDGQFLRRWALTAGVAPSNSVVYEVLPLVRRCWPAIESLAVQIEEHGEISHKHVVKALGLSSNHELHPFELANIRANLRPIPAR